MLTLILSILFWCMPKNRTLGTFASILSLIGFIVDFFLVGWYCIIDLIILIVNVSLIRQWDRKV